MEDFDVSLKVKEFVCEKVGMPVSHCEPIQIIEYTEGQKYAEHQDDRYATALIQLNKRYQGGETHFPNRCLKVETQTGNLIVWTNFNEDNSSDLMNRHEVTPVTSGVKYSAVLFVRDQPYEKE